jgi:hypothetical protein
MAFLKINGDCAACLKNAVNLLVVYDWIPWADSSVSSLTAVGFS